MIMVRVFISELQWALQSWPPPNAACTGPGNRVRVEQM
jgi:hypothetical protein